MRFGEMIAQKNVLICFLLDWLQSPANVVELASGLEDKIKVITIDMAKNQELCDALRIKKPQFKFYSECQLIQTFADGFKTEEIIEAIELILERDGQKTH